MKNEEKLRLKSRDIWIKVGDRKTNFFHNFASFPRNLNAIWNISDENGTLSLSQDKIELAAESFFKSLFKDQKSALIGNQLKVLEHYPSFFTREEGLKLGKEITLEEIQKVLLNFANAQES